jgi:aminoglycoside 6-adenylyltransferase
MLDKIVEWGKKEKSIQALILLGSRASRHPVDHYSDYDISVFSDSSELYTNSEKWLAQLGNVWVCVKEKIIYEGKTFPTRLVIYEGGIKVDFSFFPTQILNKIVRRNTLPDEYNLGYKILLDKENGTNGILSPKFDLKPTKPAEEEFQKPSAACLSGDVIDFDSLCPSHFGQYVFWNYCGHFSGCYSNSRADAFFYG